MRRAVIFAHYDAEGRVRRYVLQHLAALRRCCREVVFSSTSPLDEAGKARVQSIADHYLAKENVGFDFGMWKLGLASLDLNSVDELVLTNSSVFGPVRPLEPLLQEMSARTCDFWGVTSSEELAWHLQSYFLVFKRQVLQSQAFRSFWDSVLDLKDKGQVIRSYELGLTSFLTQHGFVGEARFHANNVFPRPPFHHLHIRRRYNLTSDYPELLLDAGSPFVKVEALRDNFRGIPLQSVRRRMEALGYDMSLIEFDRPETWARRMRHPYYYVQKPLTDALLRWRKG